MLLAAQGEYCSTANFQALPLCFEGIWNFLRYVKTLSIYSTISCGTPNDALWKSAWDKLVEYTEIEHATFRERDRSLSTGWRLVQQNVITEYLITFWLKTD